MMLWGTSSKMHLNKTLHCSNLQQAWNDGQMQSKGCNYYLFRVGSSEARDGATVRFLGRASEPSPAS